MLCYYAECHVLFIVNLNVIILSVIMLNVIMWSVVMLSVVASNIMLVAETVAILTLAPWVLQQPILDKLV